MKTPTVAVALHDGYYGCGTGAGRSNRAIIEIIVGLLPAGVRLVVLPVRLDPTSSEYDPDWHATTIALLARVGAEVIPVDNGTGGQARFGGLGQFRRLVADTADALVHQILPDAAPLLIMGCDAPFLGLAPRLPASAVQKLVLVPRSTAGIHAPGDHERRAWEFFGMHATSSGGGRIAAISRYMAQHLHHDYAIPADTLVDLPVALTAADWDIPAPDPRLLPDPAREGFVLAMGRAHPYKGFDDLLDAAILLCRTGFPLPHLVVAAVTDDPHPNGYQRHLAERITTADLDATLITRFDTGIRNLLGHHALRAIVVPSRAEPCGRIPIEAYAAGACPVIGTTAGGLAEQILHGYTGFTAPPADPAGLAAGIRAALIATADPWVRERIRCQARQFARTHYHLPTAVRRFLTAVAPWLVSEPVDHDR